jgi:hypothetical protein
MNTERIEQALEAGLIKVIQTGDVFKLPYEAKIDATAELRQAHKNINYQKVYARITELLEEELAQKIVNKIITEMGTDIKSLMSNNEIREDFKYLMRKGVETIMEKVKEPSK